jgi:hypothetical protein
MVRHVHGRLDYWTLVNIANAEEDEIGRCLWYIFQQGIIRIGFGTHFSATLSYHQKHQKRLHIRAFRWPNTIGSIWNEFMLRSASVMKGKGDILSPIFSNFCCFTEQKPKRLKESRCNSVEVSYIKPRTPSHYVRIYACTCFKAWKEMCPLAWVKIGSWKISEVWRMYKLQNNFVLSDRSQQFVCLLK